MRYEKKSSINYIKKPQQNNNLVFLSASSWDGSGLVNFIYPQWPTDTATASQAMTPRCYFLPLVFITLHLQVLIWCCIWIYFFLNKSDLLHLSLLWRQVGCTKQNICCTRLKINRKYFFIIKLTESILTERHFKASNCSQVKCQNPTSTVPVNRSCSKFVDTILNILYKSIITTHCRT